MQARAVMVMRLEEGGQVEKHKGSVVLFDYLDECLGAKIAPRRGQDSSRDDEAQFEEQLLVVAVEVFVVDGPVVVGSAEIVINPFAAPRPVPNEIYFHRLFRQK
jgi:hypothetical protein